MDTSRGKVRPWQDEETLRWAAGRFDRHKDAAPTLGCDRRTVDRWMKRHDVDQETPEWQDRDVLREWFVRQGMSQRQIANRVDRAQDTIAYWLEKFEIVKYECPSCDRTLPTKKGLKLHHNSIHGESIAGVELECDNCNDPFRRPPSHESYARFCSRECKGEWMSETFTGEDHPNWKGGLNRDYGKGWNEEKKQAVRERDGMECRDCGLSNARHQDVFECALHVHHIRNADGFQFDSDRNAVENLVSLCAECHMKWEHRRTPEELIAFLSA